MWNLLMAHTRSTTVHPYSAILLKTEKTRSEWVIKKQKPLRRGWQRVFYVVPDDPQISSVMSDGAKISHVMRDWTSPGDALFSFL